MSEFQAGKWASAIVANIYGVGGRPDLAAVFLVLAVICAVVHHYEEGK